MTAPDLPAELKVALDERLHGLSRHDAAERSALISQTYREGGNSRTIRTETGQIRQGHFQSPDGDFAQTTELTQRQQDLLRALQVPEPPHFGRITPA